METIVLLGAALLLMRVGQVLYTTGLCRSKNAAGTAMRGVADLCVATLAFWAVGAAVLLQQHNRVFGFDAGMLLGWSGERRQLFVYAAAILLATGVVGGTLAERSRFFPLCAASVLLAALVVPVAGHWAWHGWLRGLGFTDPAGASVLHVGAGMCAAVGAIVTGPRTGKYNRDRSANMIPGHNVPLAAVGALLMLVAWFPYVIGCGILHPANSLLSVRQLPDPMNLLVAAAAGGAAAMVLGYSRYRKADIVLTLAGLLGGLVAVSAADHRLGSPSAFVIGLIAGLLVPLSAVALDLVGHVDDPTSGVAIHSVAGAWGTLAVAIFSPGSFAERLKALGVQALGLVAIVALSAGLSLALFAVMKATVGLRLKEADEYDGLDLAEHDIGAYPDFQQTMIKSYHLREA